MVTPDLLSNRKATAMVSHTVETLEQFLEARLCQLSIKIKALEERIDRDDAARDKHMEEENTRIVTAQAALSVRVDERLRAIDTKQVEGLRALETKFTEVSLARAAQINSNTDRISQLEGKKLGQSSNTAFAISIGVLILTLLNILFLFLHIKGLT